MDKYSDTAVNCAKYIQDHLKRSYVDAKQMHEQVHLLLYLSLKEGYAIFREPIFEASFVSCTEGLHCLQLDAKDPIFQDDSNSFGLLKEKTILILNSVLEQYGLLDNQTLMHLIAQDSAWTLAKQHSAQQEECLINNDQIFEDAKKINRLKSLWCMDQCLYSNRSQKHTLQQ